MAGVKPMSHVEIRVSCNKLKNKDLTSKSDPCCVLFMMKEGDWVELGRTETIMNNLDPSFEHAFEVEYIFDEVQMIRFELYDIDKMDNKTASLDHDDFLGQLETTVAEVVSESPLTRPLVLKKGGKPAGGTMTLRSMDCTSQRASTEILQLSFRAEKLDKKDVVGKSDPFLEFCRSTTDGKLEVVHRTEVIKNNLNPTWKPLRVKQHLLSGGNPDSPIKVVCKDWDSNGKHEVIGTFTTSVAELIKDASGRQWPCINDAKVNKKKYENSGVIFLTACEVIGGLFRGHPKMASTFESEQTIFAGSQAIKRILKE